MALFSCIFCNDISSIRFSKRISSKKQISPRTECYKLNNNYVQFKSEVHKLLENSIIRKDTLFLDTPIIKRDQKVHFTYDSLSNCFSKYKSIMQTSCVVKQCLKCLGAEKLVKDLNKTLYIYRVFNIPKYLFHFLRYDQSLH